MPECLYKVLGLTNKATEKEIVQAYRRRSLECHPDRNPDGADAFKRIGHAYEVLKDGERRALYDATGSTGDGTVPDAKPTLAGEDMEQLLGDFYGAYRDSAEERRDITRAFAATDGSFVKMITQELLFDNTVGELARLRATVEAMIAAGQLPAAAAWTRTTTPAVLAKLERRMKREREEASEVLAAMQASSPAGKKGGRRAEGGGDAGLAGLQALILGRQQQAKADFEVQMNTLESKYVSSGGKKGRR